MTWRHFLRLLNGPEPDIRLARTCIETETVTSMPTELPGVHVERIDGRKLRCQAGQHVIITDRKIADGGTDAGCTSGELLLISIGSCAAGSTRRYLQENALPLDDLAVDVSLKPAVSAGLRDIISIEVFVSEDIPEQDMQSIENAALSGGVVSRLALGSEIEVLIHRMDRGGRKKDDQDVE
jgi:uncharacterized OsmC-like protein